MLVRPTTKWPVKLPIGLGDRQVVDACDAALHETLLVKLPVLIPVRTEPVSTVVVALVGEAYGDPIVCEGPEFFDKPVVELSRPFPCQKCFNLGSAVHKF